MIHSRREFLEAIAAASAAAALGCSRKGDAFAQERVCIHVFQPSNFLPAPLLERTGQQPRRRNGSEYFNAGLPELAICTTHAGLLESFPYVWPFSRDDLEALQKAIEIRYQKSSITSQEDPREFVARLQQLSAEWKRQPVVSAVIFTWNEATRQWCADIAQACREFAVEEFVVLKDPTIPPYLCDYPGKQRGFKRPPP